MAEKFDANDFNLTPSNLQLPTGYTKNALKIKNLTAFLQVGYCPR